MDICVYGGERLFVDASCSCESDFDRGEHDLVNPILLCGLQCLR